MSALKKALEVQAILDPGLLADMEQEFGSKWRDVLTKEVEQVSGTPPKLSKVEGWARCSDYLDERQFARALTIKQVREVATFYDVKFAKEKEAAIVANIYKAKAATANKKA